MTRLEFHARFGLLLAIVGGLGLALGLWVFMHGVTPTFAIAPLVCLVLGVANMNTPLLVLEERWFSARPSPLWGVREILYEYVRGMEWQENKLVVRLDAIAGEDCVLPMGSFAPDVRARIEKELAARIERH